MIKLTDKFSLDADDCQYTVGTPYTRSDRKTGQEVTTLKNPMYYATLSCALKGTVERILRERVANEEITTLKEYLIHQNDLQYQFGDMFEAIGVC